MKSWLRTFRCVALLGAGWFLWGASTPAIAQGYRPREQQRSRFLDERADYEPDPAPQMVDRGDEFQRPVRPRNYLYPRYGKGSPAQRAAFDSLNGDDRFRPNRDIMRTAHAEAIAPGSSVEPFPDESTMGPPGRPGASYAPPQGSNFGPGQAQQRPFYGPGDQYVEQGEQGWGGGYGDGYGGDGDGYGGGDCCDGGCDCGPHDVGVLGQFKSSCIFSPAIWQNFTEWGGAQAFKNPIDRGINGNFGFHKGFNWAFPVSEAMKIGSQVGGQIMVSDFEGNRSTFGTTREQYFLTMGLFRRAQCFAGWQGGVAIDYLHDSFYVKLNLWQVRTEISYQLCGNEVGFWSATHLSSTSLENPEVRSQSVTYQSFDQYNIFYRHRFCAGGWGRAWLGLDNYGDFLWGSDAFVPFNDNWGVQASYNYLWPNRNQDNLDPAIQESFSVMVNLVWSPKCKVPNPCFNPYRALFGVADNGSFIENQKGSGGAQ